MTANRDNMGPLPLLSLAFLVCPNTVVALEGPRVSSRLPFLYLDGMEATVCSFINSMGREAQALARLKEGGPEVEKILDGLRPVWMREN